MARSGGIEVRVADKREYTAVGDLLVDAYRSVWSEATVAGYEPELKSVPDRVDSGAVVLVAALHGQLLGTVTYDPLGTTAPYVPGGAAGLRMLGVRPTHQRRGVGRLLVQSCIDRARAAGCQRIVLESDDDLTGAHRLYETLGFTRFPDIDRELEPAVTSLGFHLGL